MLRSKNKERWNKNRDNYDSFKRRNIRQTNKPVELTQHRKLSPLSAVNISLSSIDVARITQQNHYSRETSEQKIEQNNMVVHRSIGHRSQSA